jgi:hypothetical protein
MKRGRKTPIAPPPPGLAKEVALRAQQKLAETYAGFLDDTTDEDPKRFIARSTAAREALEHLAQLRALAMEEAAEEDAAEPSAEELLAAARAQLAGENIS